MISQAEVEIAARLPIKQNINTGKTICQRTQKNGGGFFCPTDKLQLTIRIFLVAAWGKAWSYDTMLHMTKQKLKERNPLFIVCYLLNSWNLVYFFCLFISFCSATLSLSQQVKQELFWPALLGTHSKEPGIRFNRAQNNQKLFLALITLMKQNLYLVISKTLSYSLVNNELAFFMEAICLFFGYSEKGQRLVQRTMSFKGNFLFDSPCIKLQNFRADKTREEYLRQSSLNLQGDCST